jgi:hypothetical protein
MLSNERPLVMGITRITGLTLTSPHMGPYFKNNAHGLGHYPTTHNNNLTFPKYLTMIFAHLYR